MTSALSGQQNRSQPMTEHVDVLLVCSAGGHLLQMYLLRDAWRDVSHSWVSLNREDARSLLAGEVVHYGYGPTTRNILNLLRNLRLALSIVRRTRPSVIVTTGAGLAVPFAWIGRLTGAKVVYVESLTRINRPSLSCRLIRPVASRIYVQWPELVNTVSGSTYVGTVLTQS
jgi:UDP-N-acetylglucosamine:LPS N-acetylglucosamine transferase